MQTGELKCQEPRRHVPCAQLERNTHEYTTYSYNVYLVIVFSLYIGTGILLCIYSSTGSTAQHSTAQHSAITPAKAANQVRADQSTYQRSTYVHVCDTRVVSRARSSWHLQVACLHLKCRTILRVALSHAGLCR